MLMLVQAEYDIAIIGGGLAGLAAAIQLKQKGYHVALFEKEKYPFHKVCGEYISLESFEFLLSLGLPLQAWNLPIIKKLELTAVNGKAFNTGLPLGGFGISRYKLDSALADIALTAGVHLADGTKVSKVASENGTSVIETTKGNTKAAFCLGAFGKKANLDVRLNRSFLQERSKKLNNFVGIKYHIKTDWPKDVIGLHNFKNGYCGISAIEDDMYCLCYLTTAENLKSNGNNILTMEEKLLYKNAFLKNIFTNSTRLQNFPVSISQISFANKSKTEDGMLMLGDAAGMISPLCGNGMSIALHTSKIAATLVDACLQKKISPAQLTGLYQQQWHKHFATRLRTGRIIQGFFGSNTLSNVFVSSFRALPFLAKPLIRLTHGQPF